MNGLIGSLEDGSFRGNWAHTSVVDFDRDGWDDVYVMPYNAPALFFRNRGDGTFEEIAGSLGLGLAGVNGALFADFDNDDHPDILFRENWAIQLLLGPDTASAAPPVLEAVSIHGSLKTVADFDADGRLDIAAIDRDDGIAWVTVTVSRTFLS